jgi:hypothetical protein
MLHAYRLMSPPSDHAPPRFWEYEQHFSTISP